jgi:hypothetical protein
VVPLDWWHAAACSQPPSRSRVHAVFAGSWPRLSLGPVARAMEDHSRLFPVLAARLDLFRPLPSLPTRPLLTQLGVLPRRINERRQLHTLLYSPRARSLPASCMRRSRLVARCLRHVVAALHRRARRIPCARRRSAACGLLNTLVSGMASPDSWFGVRGSDTSTNGMR